MVGFLMDSFVELMLRSDYERKQFYEKIIIIFFLKTREMEKKSLKNGSDWEVLFMIYI